MLFRKTTEKDIERIMEIIKEAQDYFKEMKIDQWQSNYPNSEIILNDVKNDSSYVLEDNDEIIATVMISFDEDKTYNKIYEGAWLSNSRYAVIHRIAVSESYKGNGIASTIIDKAKDICLEKGVNSIKIDTHKDNIVMQNLLKKNNFKYCGIIYLEDGNERIAFESLI